MKIARILVWLGVAGLGAMAFAAIAWRRGEPISAMWLLVAAICTYALGYRFYSKFVAAKVLTPDAMRATPAERLENGRDFIPTNKWVVFGHHFAAIAGTVSFIAVLSILVILLAVVALIIVNALKASPWGAVTIGLTIPIALLMG